MGQQPTYTKAGASATSPVDNKQRKEVLAEKPEKVLLFLLFFPTGKLGGKFYSEAAQTRLQNIKNADWFDSKLHKVHCPPFEDISEVLDIIPNYIKKYGGKKYAFIREVGIFSHAGGDGPVSTLEASRYSVPHRPDHQMALEGWASIDFNWDPEKPSFMVYGCDSALEAPPVDNPTRTDYKNFAQDISTQANFKGVEVWGQSTKSAPSFFPDYRVTSLARSMGTGWDIGPTYQIATAMGGGTKAIQTTGWNESTPESLSKSFDKALPMRCYKNGSKIRETHQGVFNDHRQNSKYCDTFAAFGACSVP